MKEMHFLHPSSFILHPFMNPFLEGCMNKYSVDDIRNLAFVGHAAAGKTSLADALLFQARAVDRRGSVDDGSSVSDYDDEEKKRKHSIDSSLLHLDYKGKHLNIIDGPGYPDFLGAS